jgi:hypothetical protein
MRPEPETLLRRLAGRLASRTSPEPEMVTSAESLGAASTLPLPEILAVSSFIARSASRASPDPEMVTVARSTVPWARTEPLPLILKARSG